MTFAVAATTGDRLITCEYNPAEVDGVAPGLAWAILHDNAVLAWLVDETGAAPAAPVILGTMPGAAPDAAPVLSPSWATRQGGTIFVPDTMRGSAHEFFNFIATNNGAARPIYAKFADYELALSWESWVSSHPTLALSAPPNVAVEPPPEA